jgi:hypothetical protein
MDAFVKFIFLHSLYRNVIARKEACTNAGYTYTSGVGCVDQSGNLVPMYSESNKTGGKHKRSGKKQSNKTSIKKRRTEKNT